MKPENFFTSFLKFLGPTLGIDNKFGLSAAIAPPPPPPPLTRTREITKLQIAKLNTIFAKCYYKENRRTEIYDDYDEEDADENGIRVPPHEFLARQMARTRITSFSVHEGIGRTLKGRDLSRVRDAIWQKTGFED